MRNRLIFAVMALTWTPLASADDWKVGEPIVAYWAGPGFPGGGPLDDASAARLADGGWNLAWCHEGELDVASRHRLRGLLSDPLLVPESLKDPKRREALAALVDRVKGHPALYAYHLIDEPGAAAFPALGKLVAFLRERDPAHLASINLLPIYANNQQLGIEGPPVQAYAEHLRRFSEVVRPALLSYDHYQFTRKDDGPQYFLNLAMVREQALASGVPFMNIVQASSWVPGSAASPTSPRVPGPDELRFLAYTTLAYGAQGISYYVYRYPGHEGGMLGDDGTPTPLGKEARTLNREFAAIARELQPLRSLAVHQAGMQPPGAARLPAGLAFTLEGPVPDEEYQPGDRVLGILLGRFGPSGEGSHLLAVNLDYRAERTAVIVGPSPIETFDAATGEWTAAGNRVELRLPGGGGKLLRLRP
ncbi:hypothetical protein TA3x_001544 [Tundrisphaera sp. TA3]|uniref:hypothetical protein n=1 Tax=Tundrisphaera sp. TA3 TaxID=3435775 RepID=UPI003EBA7A7B